MKTKPKERNLVASLPYQLELSSKVHTGFTKMRRNGAKLNWKKNEEN